MTFFFLLREVGDAVDVKQAYRILGNAPVNVLSRNVQLIAVPLSIVPSGHECQLDHLLRVRVLALIERVHHGCDDHGS